MKAAHLMDAGSGDFRGLLGELDLVIPRAVGAAHGTEFVDPAEGALITTRDEPGADSPHIDGGALMLQALDQLFIEIITRDDGRAMKSRGIEEFAGFDTCLLYTSPSPRD